MSRIIALAAVAVLLPVLEGWSAPPALGTPAGDPIILTFTATAAGEWPYVLLGDAIFDPTETVKVKVNWGETGDPSTSTTTIITSVGQYRGSGLAPPVTYPAAGTYTVTISPLRVADDPVNGTDTGPWLTIFGYGRTSSASVGSSFFDGSARLTGVTDFGDLGVTSLSSAFAGQIHLVDVPAAIPSGVTHLSGTFEDSTGFNDPDVGSWDVSSVVDMDEMFQNASSFNQSLLGWADKVGNVVDFGEFLEDAVAFDQPMTGWDVSSATSLDQFFHDATSFDGDLSGWKFNPAPGSVDISDFLEGATAFDQPLSSWTTTSFVDTEDMFSGATSFDQDISGWDVSNVTAMAEMFNGASSFDRSLGGWTLNGSADLGGMLDGSGLSTACYDATLVGWSGLLPGVTGLTLGATGLTYSSVGKAARDTLTGAGTWSISGDSEVPSATGTCGTATTSAPVAATSALALACIPSAPASGETVTCAVSGGDPDIEILWRAGAPAPFASAGVRLGPDGAGAFSFTVPDTTSGTVDVELVGWGVRTALALDGDAAVTASARRPVPTAVRAGGGSIGAVPLPRSAGWLALMVVAVGLALWPRLQRAEAGGQDAAS